VIEIADCPAATPVTVKVTGWPPLAFADAGVTETEPGFELFAANVPV
jgi:hypothetical protein